MSFGIFLLGVILMIIGFFMVRKTNLFLNWFGDLGALLGFLGASWLSWKLLGIFFILFGFLLATSLLELFLKLTIGRLFSVGGF